MTVTKCELMRDLEGLEELIRLEEGLREKRDKYAHTYREQDNLCFHFCMLLVSGGREDGGKVSGENVAEQRACHEWQMRRRSLDLFGNARSSWRQWLDRACQQVANGSAKVSRKPLSDRSS